MKKLIVYQNKSFQKYHDFYRSYTFEIDDNTILSIFKHSKTTGEPTLIACYKEWDYFIIDEDFEDLK